MWSGKTPHGLKEVMFDDYDEFVSAVEKGYKNVPSYLVIFKNTVIVLREPLP